MPAVCRLSPAQARQTWAPVLHTGSVPPHSALVVQLTQVPVETLQAGMLPEHIEVWTSAIKEGE